MKEIDANTASNTGHLEVPLIVPSSPKPYVGPSDAKETLFFVTKIGTVPRETAQRLEGKVFISFAEIGRRVKELFSSKKHAQNSEDFPLTTRQYE